MQRRIQTHRVRAFSVFMSFLCLCSAFPCQGCKNTQNIDALSDEEKIAVQVAGESSLSEPEQLRQQEARRQILERTHRTQDAEKALSEALQDAKQVLPDGMYQNLSEAQTHWLRSGRGADINALVQKGVPVGDAFAKATQMRADRVRIQTSKLMLALTPGSFGGYYQTADERQLELYEMPNETLNMVLRAQDADIDMVVTATGRYEAQQARLCSEQNKSLCFNLTKIDKDTILISPDSEAQLDPILPQTAPPLIEAYFKRVSPDELTHDF